jgi:hypothetical protein
VKIVVRDEEGKLTGSVISCVGTAFQNLGKDRGEDRIDVNTTKKV